MCLRMLNIPKYKIPPSLELKSRLRLTQAYEPILLSLCFLFFILQMIYFKGNNRNCNKVLDIAVVMSPLSEL